MQGILSTLALSLPFLSALDASPCAAQAKQDPETTQARKDSDGDGLSDYQELHKYLTNPKKADSDGDGIPDGDWRERREYQYTVRSVVHVMRPVTPDFISGAADDYQDVRVLDETATHFELEVIHYPFNRVAESVRADPHWRLGKAHKQTSLARWLEPGPSSDWTPALRKELLRALARDKIQVKKLDDKKLVERVSEWLCARAPHASGCTIFVTAWDDHGKAYVPEVFREQLDENLAKRGRKLDEQWEREVSGSGMFRNKTRGSCSSSAIYLSTCLRALGIPTRTILCIPVLDASDPRELELLQNIQHLGVRRQLADALKELRSSWASHTFNEVYVGGRWRRLNYSRLGQGIYDRQYFGLLTHVATFHDWADARFWESVGRRQKSSVPKDIFGHRNPYSTISLRDEVGVHCRADFASSKLPPMRVRAIRWTDDPSLPEDIRKNCKERGRFGLIAEIHDLRDGRDFVDFVRRCDLRAYLRPSQSSKRDEALAMQFDPGCYWIRNSRAWIYVSMQERSKTRLRRSRRYSFETGKAAAGALSWELAEAFTIARKRRVPESNR